MARYFFHTQTDTRLSDDEGVELTSPTEARALAIKTAGELMRDSPEPFWGSRPWTVVVTNETGLILWEISMDGVALAGAPR